MQVPDFLRNFIARIYLKYHIESLRAIEGIQQSAVLQAVLRNRKQVLVSDIVKVIPLALKHRTEVDTLTKIMNNLDKGDDGGMLEASRRDASSSGSGDRGGKGGLKSIFGSKESKSPEPAERDSASRVASRRNMPIEVMRKAPQARSATAARLRFILRVTLRTPMAVSESVSPA